MKTRIVYTDEKVIETLRWLRQNLGVFTAREAEERLGITAWTIGKWAKNVGFTAPFKRAAMPVRDWEKIKNAL